MSYTKNHNPWAASDLMTTAALDNFETIYTEVSTYLSGHNHDSLYQTKGEMVAAYWNSGNDGPGSGADADMLYKASGNLHAADFSGLGVATGLVVLWYGSVASIPDGWHLCDGDAGTIDLRGRIPIGAGTGASRSVGTTGGSATFTATGTITIDSHVLTIDEMGPHTHPFYDVTPTISGYPYDTSSGSGVVGNRSYSVGTTAGAGGGNGHTHSAAEGTAMTGNAVSCLPYSLALCYIQKI